MTKLYYGYLLATTVIASEGDDYSNPTDNRS